MGCDSPRVPSVRSNVPSGLCSVTVCRPVSVIQTCPRRSIVMPWTKLEPLTVSEKLPRLVEAGEMPVREGVGLRRVTAEEADWVLSAAIVAVIEIVLGEGRVVGAV